MTFHEYQKIIKIFFVIFQFGFRENYLPVNCSTTQIGQPIVTEIQIFKVDNVHKRILFKVFNQVVA